LRGLPVSAGRALPAGAFPATATTQKLQGLTDDLHLRALGPGLLVIPGVEFQAALDVERLPLLGVVAGDFSQTAPEFDLHKGDLLLGFLPDLVFAVDSEADACERSALGGCLDFDFAGEVSDEDDFVYVGHNIMCRLVS